MSFRKAFLVFGFSLFLCSVTWAQVQEKLCDSETSFGRSDKTLFGRYCGVCHSLSGQWKRVGPPLGNLYKQKQLVTGQAVSDEAIRGIISSGITSFMPGFQYTLKPAEIAELVRYLRMVRCSDASSLPNRTGEK